VTLYYIMALAVGGCIVVWIWGFGLQTNLVSNSGCWDAARVFLCLVKLKALAEGLPWTSCPRDSLVDSARV